MSGKEINRGGHPGKGSVEKPKNFKETLRKTMVYLSPHKIKFIIVMIFAILSSVFSIIGPKIMGKATTSIFKGLVEKVTGAGPGIDFEYIGKIIMILVGLYSISAIFQYIQGFIITGVAQKVSYGLRKEIAEKINKLPLSYFDTRSTGDVLSRVTNDVDTISQTLNQSLSQIITAITTIIGVLIMMLSISWQMTLVALLILPITMILIKGIAGRSQIYFRDQQKLLGEVNGHIEEVYSGHTIMKAFNGEKESIKKFDSINDELYSTAWKSQFLSGMMRPIMSFVGNLGYVAVSILGGYLAIRNIIEVGEILSFIQYISNFTQPLAQVAQISNVLQSTVAASERVFEFLEEEEEIKELDRPVKLNKVKGEVIFDHVKFGYNEDNIIINDFSKKIEPGKKVAIVGPTGAGKTTIVKLLMRFYDINDGAILVDGEDIRDFRRSDLRNNFGMVLQDTWLFSGTIMENIRYGRLDASDEEVIEAAKSAHAHRFIQTLPEGYNMEINEEADNISQGQKQLLTIARAILSNPSILILDEATSSVDTRTELLIKKAMDNLMEGRTSFIIAHRLSTIRDADSIIVMDRGDIVEVGSHDELIEKGQYYYNLYNSQFSDVG